MPNRTPSTTRSRRIATAPGTPKFLARLNADAPKRARITFDRRIPFGQGAIEQYRLGNGLRVLLLEDHAAPVVAYHVWFRVGSRHEVEGKTGLAHLFEHLMFNETKNLPAGTFDRRLEAAGAHTNAGTWNDWTYYHEDAPASQLALVVKLEADRMQNLVLREPQVASEKEVVANERRYRVDDDVDGAVNELLYKTAFDVHPYHHPTIGWMEDILAFTTGDCRTFYKTYYAPNNATVVIVGDFAPAATLAKLQKHYGVIGAAKIPDEASQPEPRQKRERLVQIEKSTPTAKLAIGYHSPALSDASHAALSILSEALFGGRSARLYRSIVTELELATDLAASASMSFAPGLFEVYATAREGVSAEDMLHAVDEGFAALAQRPVTDDERDRAVARTELSFLQGLETVGGRAEQIGFFDAVLGEPAGSLARLELLRAVTTEQLADAARRFLDPTQRTVILVSPDAPGADSNGGES
ncbi:MAG: pitrilysin family protein [Deltaproteobacteria bacterium]